jgi:hypothetical protein
MSYWRRQNDFGEVRFPQSTVGTWDFVRQARPLRLHQLIRIMLITAMGRMEHDIGNKVISCWVEVQSCEEVYTQAEGKDWSMYCLRLNLQRQSVTM